MKGPVFGTLHILFSPQALDFRSENEAQRLRRDDIHVLVLDDHEDSEKIRADGDQCLLAYG
jgi:hypothetical protein